MDRVYYTDGAASMKCVNGEYIRENGGAAFILIDNNEIIYEEKKHFNQTTNNFCELYAIYMALKHFHNNFLNSDCLKIYCDSAYCVNMLKPGGWVYGWVKNDWTRGKKHEPIENIESSIWIFSSTTLMSTSVLKIMIYFSLFNRYSASSKSGFLFSAGTSILFKYSKAISLC